ncbi:glycosyltransferase family protein [Tritonibacter mobilis]|uniref:glycosyltransferase n=1 Tax=Tritonibacter mobilis TaxID=379347 RepID=UPI0008068343|nr:glycosyltransferase [Tritonibacter mobilis]
MGLPKLLKKSTYPLAGLRIVNAAYRKRPDTPQGGPAGVQRLVEDVVGKMYRGIHMHYTYETVVKPSLEVDTTIKELNLTPMMGKNLCAAESLEQVITEKCNKNYFSSAYAQNKNYFVLCHDIGSALGALEMGVPYSLVYHQQGSSCFELEAAGNYLNSASRNFLNETEKLVFENAVEVYFPSVGAQKTFFETTTNVARENVNLGAEPLYNTVADLSVDPQKARNFLAANGLAKLMLPEIREQYRIMISVGDYNDSKGMERSFDFACKLDHLVPKKVLWIGIGRRNRSGRFSEIQTKAKTAGIETLLIGDRLPHDLVMSLVDFSDQFVMMQHHSIFDFSSIEAMALSKSLVLSPVGGNLEFNKADNVAFFDPNATHVEQDKMLRVIAELDLRQHGQANYETFTTHFSKSCFERRYLAVYDRIIKHTLRPCTDEAGLPQATLAKARDTFQGKNVLILGPGHSASQLMPRDFNGKVVVALNSALELDHIPFDVHFMQDEPTKQGAWKRYRARQVQRFYGHVATPGMSHIQMDFDMIEKICGPVYSYNLASDRFDARHDCVLPDLSKRPILDMQSIAFTAMQVAGFAGAHSISIAGVDFSVRNHDGPNPNKYAGSVLDNLRFLSRSLRAKGVLVDVLHTTSQAVRDAVDDIEPLREEFENLSSFRVLQWYAKNALYAEALEYIRLHAVDNWFEQPKYLREIAQIHFENQSFDEAHYFFKEFFFVGGESKICRKKLKICEERTQHLA